MIAAPLGPGPLLFLVACVLVAHWPQIADDLIAWWQLVPFVLLLSVSAVVAVLALALPVVRKARRQPSSSEEP